jgi:hypothetical protein
MSEKLYSGKEFLSTLKETHKLAMQEFEENFTLVFDDGSDEENIKIGDRKIPFRDWAENYYDCYKYVLIKYLRNK